MIRLKPLLEGPLLETSYDLFCDLDGVLCDFDKAWLQLTGVTPSQYRAANGGDKFRDQLDQAPESFWSDMDWMEGGQQVWEVMSKHPCRILSAPARSKQSVTGKKKWIQKHVPGTEAVFKPAHEKQLLAHADAILVDDYDKNIKQWQSRKGIGILHTTAEQTLAELSKYNIT